MMEKQVAVLEQARDLSLRIRAITEQAVQVPKSNGVVLLLASENSEQCFTVTAVSVSMSREGLLDVIEKLRAAADELEAGMEERE